MVPKQQVRIVCVQTSLDRFPEKDWAEELEDKVNDEIVRMNADGLELVRAENPVYQERRWVMTLIFSARE